MQTQSSFPHRLGALAVVVLLLLSLHGVNSAVHSDDDHGKDKDHDHADASSDHHHPPEKEKLPVDDHHDHDDAHKPADGLPSASDIVLAIGKAASKGAVSFHAFNGDIPPPAQALILKELERLYPEEVHAEDEALLGKLSEKTKQHLKTLLKNYNTAAKLRTYYNNEVAKINGFVDAAAKRWKKKASKLSLTRRQRAAMRAYLACSLRHLRRVIVRLAQDMDSIGCLKVFALWARSRDKKKYGNADGPTFLWLVAKEEAQFKKCHGVGPSPSNDDEYITIYRNIRESALRTNSKINAAFDKKKKPATAAAVDDKKPAEDKKPSDKKKGKEEKKSVEDFNSLKCSREQLVSLRELDKEEESQVSEDEACALHHNHKSNNNNKKVEDHKEKPPAEQTPPLKASGGNKNDKKGRKGGKSHKF